MITWHVCNGAKTELHAPPVTYNYVTMQSEKKYNANSFQLNIFQAKKISQTFPRRKIVINHISLLYEIKFFFHPSNAITF